MADLWNTHVYVAQEKGPTPTFNETDATLSSGRANALDGCHCTGGKEPWLGPYSNSAFEVKAHDPGIGISWAKVEVGSYKLEMPFWEEGLCAGIQCKEDYATTITYSPGMPDGEQTIDWYAANLAGSACESCPGLTGHEAQLVKIDATPPHSLEVSGLPSNREVSATPHTLTLEATDGTTGTHSSGIKAIAASVDGGAETPVTGLSCSPSCSLGPTTGKGSWTLHAEGLSEGVHRLVVTATDNASNVASTEYTFDVRHSTPVPVGPGSVDPTSGQFALSATDVSLAGTTGVARVSESRNTTIGGEGPLGAQWAMSIGDGQGLTVLPNGTAVLVSPAGRQTTFSRNSKGEYKSPLGDASVKLEGKEAEAGKGITEYTLADSAAGTKTKFVQPTGTENTSPAYANQFGSEGAGLTGPESEATDSSGNLWVADYPNSRIEKFSPAGVLLGSYGWEGQYPNEFKAPWGIAVNQSNGHVYVSDQGNNRIEELNSSGSFVQMMGWGVTDGKAEFEICKAHCRAGIAGSGNGQMNVEGGMAVDAAGNVWLADYGNNRVQEFNEKGEFVRKFGVLGSGEGQFNGPLNIALSGGNLYVVDYANNRVEELSTTGTYIGQFGKEGSGGGEFKHPRGIATDPKSGYLYVTDSGNNRVQEFTPTRTLVATFGSAGAGAGQLSEPTAVAVGTGGNVFVADFNNHRIEEWTHAAWLPTVSEGPLSSATSTYAYAAVERSVGHTEIEPIEALAPVPSGITCGTKPEELKRGCRALTFNYAGSTTAAGEKASQWGDYKGNLTRVYFHAWDPSKGSMSETVVAQYAYDTLGRLRAEWDPRISPPLKTDYGYDQEGHVTALTPPGQESWAFTYGASSGDSSPGRLLKVTRAPASAALWNGEPPKDTGEPKLSGALVVGVTMGVSKGGWSNEPVAYGYQWEDCNSAGEACAAIRGATNENYTLTASDVEHTLVAQVTATNGGGSVAVSSKPSPTLGPEATSFGSQGSGAGQMERPRGMARDSKGHLWVADTNNHRVEEFNEAGTFVKAFGWGVSNGESKLQVCISSCQAGISGSGNGEMSYPDAVATDSNGDIWVADEANHRIEEFSEAGEYLRKAGSVGTGNGQFSENGGPEGIAVDSKGNVWAADTENRRIEEFNEKAEFIRAAGSLGTGNGQFERPVEVAVGPANNVFVTDWDESRVQEFNEKGEYVAKFGSAGTGPGQFEHPYGIAIDPSGHVFITDTANARVDEFSEKGEYIAQFGSEGTGPGKFLTGIPNGIAVNATGDLWVTEAQSGSIYKWLVGPAFFGEAFGSQGSGAGQMERPRGMARDSKGHLWVADTNNHRVEEFNEAGTFVKAFGWGVSNGESKLQVCISSCQAGISGSGNGEMSYPDAVATDSNGDIWVADEANHRIEEFSEAGEYLRKAGSVGTGNGQFSENGGPEGIAVDSKGNVWAADTENRRIEEFNEKAEFIRAAGSLGTGNGQFERPVEVAVGPANNVFVTDWDESRVQEFNEKGEYVAKFGSAGTGPGQFEHPYGIAIDPSGHVFITDTANARVDEFSEKGEYIAQFGSEGTGPGKFLTGIPNGIAVNATGDLWVTEAQSAAIQKWWISGQGTEGQSYAPGPGTTIEYQIPTSGTGLPNLSGTEVAKWGQKDDPTQGVAIFPPDEPQGWPASGYKRATIRYFDEHGRTVNTRTPAEGIATSEYNETNEVIRTLSADNRVTALKEARPAEASEKLDTKSTYNAEGTELQETLGPEHKVRLAGGTEVSARAHAKYYYDEGAPAEYAHDGLVTKTTVGAQYAGKEEDVRTTKTEYSAQENLGWKLRNPTSTIVEPSGLKLTSTTKYDATTGNVIETQSPAAAGKDAGLPVGYLGTFSKLGSEPGQLKEPKSAAMTGSGNVLVLDSGNNRVQEFTAAGAYNSFTFGKAGSASGQFSAPDALTVDSKGNIWVADTNNNRVQEFNAKGEYLQQFGKAGTGAGEFKQPKGIAVESTGAVLVADYGNNRLEKFNEKGEFIAAFGWGVTNGESTYQICTSSCHAGTGGSGNGQLNLPRNIALTSTGNAWIVDSANKRLQEFSEAGEYLAKFGSAGKGHGQFEEPRGIAIEASSGDIWVSDSVTDTLQQFTASGTYITSFGSKGTARAQFEEPSGFAIAGNGTFYITDNLNNRMQRWGAPISGNTEAHDHQTIYYSAGANGTYPTCGEHPEWANLPCQTQPTHQPGSTGVPEVPVSTFTYNMWDEVEATTEKLGSTIRTKTQTYDSAGRAITSEETSTADTPLPKVTNEYSTETGALLKQSTTTEGKTKTITSVFNHLGQRASYTDADGGTTTYEYEPEGDARPTKTSVTIGTEVFAQKDVYDPTTGAVAELVDTSVGTMRGTYDAEGRILTETLPNAMTATYSYNAAGEATAIEYTKTAHCATSCPEIWYSDSIAPSIHGETLAQTSSLAKDAYIFDAAGRLTQTQEEPTGKGCVTRVYGYSEEGDRISQTSREPTGEGKCAPEGGTVEYHSYDTASRLTDEGVTYDALGNAMTLPAEDAGGHELTSTYYVDGQVASQTQNGETIGYSYDPAGRTREAASTGKTSATVISHYSGEGETLSWATEAGEKWTRNVPGIDGSLTAVQANGTAPVLQLHDLQGNIVATAASSESETKLLSTYNSTEFGVPQPGTTPPKYAWLGADGLATELSSGAATSGGASYVPQVARNLQTAPAVPAGAFPNGQGTGSPYESQIAGWFTALSAEESAATLAEYAAAQEALRRKAEQEARETAERIRAEESAPRPTEGGAEEAGEEGGEEGIGISVHGAGTATVADVGPPVISCSVAAWSPVPEGRYGVYYFSGDLICDGLPARTKLKVCAQQLIKGHWKNLACSGVREGADTFLLIAGRSAYCTPGYWIRGWAWGWGALSDGSSSAGTDASGEVKCE